MRNPETKTPVFVRFSTVLGSKGSPDTVRDVRGFATRFYTQEGLWDLGNFFLSHYFLFMIGSLNLSIWLLVGNVIAPFFIQGNDYNSFKKYN